MSQKNRKQIRKKKRFYRIILIILIFGYLFFRTVPSLFAMAFKFTLPESIIIEDKVETEAIIIRKENLYKAGGKGNIKFINNEGDRISKGTEICRLILSNEDSTLKQEAEELDKKIDTLKSVEKEKDIIKGDNKKLEENIENIIINIQKKINEGDYEEVEILKDKLALFYGKQIDFSGKGYLINQSIDSLQEKRDVIKQQLSDNTIIYFSNEAGIVSYNIDGYEEIYSFYYKDDYNYSDFKPWKNKTITNENGESINAGETIFKIIDNFEWYMLLKIEDFKDISSYKEGDSILISSNEIGGEFKGNIIKINKDNLKGTILCKFDKDFHKIIDKRFLNANIIKYKHSGFKIPKRSIIEKDGLKGVYIKDISGIIKFKPIKVLEEDDKFIYICSGDENNNIVLKGSDKPIKTVTIFDEILLNTKNIKEGMIVN